MFKTVSQVNNRNATTRISVTCQSYTEAAFTFVTSSLFEIGDINAI
jgi:hypothetical protein